LVDAWFVKININFIDLEQLGIGWLNLMPRQIWVDRSEDWSVRVIHEPTSEGSDNGML
jgi:hypothetical protein